MTLKRGIGYNNYVLTTSLETKGDKRSEHVQKRSGHWKRGRVSERDCDSRKGGRRWNVQSGGEVVAMVNVQLSLGTFNLDRIYG